MQKSSRGGGYVSDVLGRGSTFDITPLPGFRTLSVIPRTRGQGLWRSCRLTGIVRDHDPHENGTMNMTDRAGASTTTTLDGNALTRRLDEIIGPDIAKTETTEMMIDMEAPVAIGDIQNARKDTAEKGWTGRRIRNVDMILKAKTIFST